MCGALVNHSFELQADRIDAIPKACGWGAVGKDVTQMCIALRTPYFGSDHAMGGVANLDHIRTIEWFEEARPSTSGLKLGTGFKQRQVAANTAEHTDSFFVQKSSAPWWLRSGESRHLESFWTQLSSPLGIRFFDFLHPVLIYGALILGALSNQTVGTV
jgi:hypothetical protein